MLALVLVKRDGRRIVLLYELYMIVTNRKEGMTRLFDGVKNQVDGRKGAIIQIHFSRALQHCNFVAGLTGVVLHH